ncbi:hypothetical protein [Rubritalea profundi]|uniref:Glycosyltransferase RgtA/B/C/D-like domain-containing protein n=1 Tax=Rubritalea profundi TaxID=1658618 RepID=A0A2S7TZB0_9BACT|nr:hypothetical protein [Rubritalea profundi]PQJ28079.1 hypothetical protein BSZ32_05885 [Rubritalea profundi]
MAKSLKSPDKYRWAPLLFFTLIGLFSVSWDSLWIDEFMTYKYASIVNINDMFLSMYEDKCSEVQMPFYVIYMWAYTKIFGIGEFALRASALPFFICGMTALATTLHRRFGSYLPIVIGYGLSPFICYYLNEARPYAIQIGLSALILASLIRLNEEAENDSTKIQRSHKRWLNIFCVAVLLLSGISMLCQLWVWAAILAAIFILPKQRLIFLIREKKLVLAATGVGLLGIGFYYLWSLTIGALAATTESPNVFSIIFIFYEQLGLTGTGPGRAELREEGARAILPFLIQLIIHSVLIGSVFVFGCVYLLRECRKKTIVSVVVCVSIPIVLILGAGILMEFRVLGRHFAPLAVAIFLVFSCGIKLLVEKRNKWSITLVTLFVIFQASSCVLVRFEARHKRDNYRLAASLANQALTQNKTVWWNANPIGATYYQLPQPQSDSSEKFTVVINPSAQNLEERSLPDLVITSKTDIFDNQMALAQFLGANGYVSTQEIHSFVFWERPVSP